MNQTHDECKYFGSKRYCPPLKNKNDIMVRANQETPEYYGGEQQQMLPFPTDEEIDAICNDCPAFTQK